MGKYDDITTGQWEAVGNKLGGQGGVGRFLRGELVVTEAFTEIPGTLTLGIHQSADAYRQALKEGGFKIGNWGHDILCRPDFTCALKETMIHPVVRSVGELGLKGSATLKEIYDRAKERGHGLCSAETGPTLRLACPRQAMGEWLFVAMEPIIYEGGFQNVFYLAARDIGLCLNGHFGRHSQRWYANNRWVFDDTSR